MLSLFKRSKAPEDSTFKARVTEFWKWFAQNAQRFYETIEDKRCHELQPEVSEQMNRLIPGCAWVFGPGANGVGHSFTFTGEGNRDRQLLAAFWLSQAPSLPGWTFYAAKQATPNIDGHRIRFDDLVFDPREFWIATHVDDQDECIDLVVWHPSFPKMEEKPRWMAIFLYLDEVLGELGTQNWVGEIKVSDTQLAESMPLTELSSYVNRVVADHGWKLAVPGDTWHSYHVNEPQQGRLRADIVAGTTCLIHLVEDMKDGYVDPDPLADTGAEFVYIAFPRSILTKGKEVESRGLIEDALIAALDESSAGQLLGGATGIDHAYIDLLLWDGHRSLELVKQVLLDQGLGKGTSIEHFAKSRSAERITL